MTVHIRAMVAGDKPSLMHILRRTPEFQIFEIAVAEEVIDAYLKDPKGSGYYIIIAEDNDGLAGYICYGPTPCTEGTWDLYWQAVAQEKRGKGIGGALSEAAETAIESAQGRLMMIETSSQPLYENTRRFHLNRGYEEIARVPDFYAPGDDKLILWKHVRHV